jgi:flagellin-like protein
MTLRKKAVSPIIATILLVVIALILVGILLSWGQNFIQRSTADADNAIDRKCIGADIEFSVCEYDSSSEALTLIIVNTGKIDFKEDTNLSLTIIDSENNLFEATDETNNLLEGAAFVKGASTQKEIDLSVSSTDLVAPFDVTIRSSQCPTFFKKTTCR